MFVCLAELNDGLLNVLLWPTCSEHEKLQLQLRPVSPGCGPAVSPSQQAAFQE